MNANLAVDLNLLEFTLFGAPQITLSGENLTGFSTSKSQALLIYLATENRAHSRDELASLFWQAMPNQQARKNLRDALYNLRKVVGDHIEITTQAVAIKNHHTVVDIERFRTLAKADATSTKDALKETLRLYRGHFLDGFMVRNAAAFNEWALRERDSLHQLAIRCALQIVRNEISSDAYTDGLETATWLLGLDPLNEEAHYYKLQLLILQGKRGDAQNHYKTYQALLEQVHGIKPIPQITALFEPRKPDHLARELPTRGTLIRGKTASDFRTLPVDILGDWGPHSPISAKEVALREESKDEKALRPILHNQILYATSFVGYQQEVGYIHRSLSEPNCRLLTITGPGGVGKTRLAAEAIQWLLHHKEYQNQFVDGAYFVPLANIQSVDSTVVPLKSDQRSIRQLTTERIVVAIADILGLRFEGSTPPKEQLSAYIHAKQLLLILDNFEHFLPAVDLVTELLTAARGLRILVTSRERLNLYSEHLLNLKGLPIAQAAAVDLSTPDPQDDQASTLFLDRTQGLASRFGRRYREPNVQERALIRRIGQLVGGMPLAIEIAAALSMQTDLVDIAHALESDIEILQVYDEGLEERHSSIPAMLNATWQRLTRDEQETLVYLDIFRGGFSLDAAQNITGAAPDVLSSLVNKSILWVTDTRYGMHALIHQYVAQKLAPQKLAAHDSITGIQTRHQHYFQTFLASRVDHWRRTHDPQSIVDLMVEQDNIAAAWSGLLAKDDLAPIVTFAKDLWWLARARGRLQEMDMILTAGITKIRAMAPNSFKIEQAELLQLLSATYNQLGKLNDSDKYGLEALQMLGHTLPTSILGWAVSIGQAFGATLLRQMVPAKKKQSTLLESMMGWAYDNLTQNNYLLNNMPEAVLCSLRAANLAGQSNEPLLITYTYAKVSILFGFLKLGRLNQAYMELAEKAAQNAIDLGAQTAVSFFRGLYLISLGRCDQAQPLIELALSRYEEMREWPRAADCLALLNVIACHSGYHEQGLRYGIRLEAIANESQNLEHGAWARLIQAVNLVYLGRIPDALEHLDKLEPIYQTLDFKDIGFFVGYSTKALAHFRLGEYQAAWDVAKYVTTLSTRNLPTSVIYLYAYHAVLEVFLGLIELEAAQEHSLSIFNQAELAKYVKSWLRKLTLLVWIHPIGKQYLWLHRGRFAYLRGNRRRAQHLFQKGLNFAGQHGDHRNQARFHYESGRYLARNEEEKITSEFLNI